VAHFRSTKINPKYADRVIGEPFPGEPTEKHPGGITTVNVVCENCKTTFNTALAYVNCGRAKFCSRKCSSKVAGNASAQANKLETRFWKSVNKTGPNDCWEWQAFKHKGYGRIKISVNGMDRAVGAHRVSCEIPDRHPCRFRQRRCKPRTWAGLC